MIMIRRRIILAIAVLASSSLAVVFTSRLASLAQPSRVTASDTFADFTDVVDKTGSMRLPRDYQTAYQFLGAWAIAADAGRGAREFHNVYASPGTIEAYRATGQFPDGAVLVKEVRAAASADMTTGQVSRAAGLTGWFMMVKDSRNRYPANPLWGDGWGWAWFDRERPTSTTTVDYRDECRGCHVPAQDTDWIYKDGYPGLAR
jgi:hypothetical protein